MPDLLETRRLRLIPATPAMIRAELDGQEPLATALGAELPVDWPPEHHDAETLVFWREQLSRPCAEGWWLHYLLLIEPVHPILTGTVGYSGWRARTRRASSSSGCLGPSQRSAAIARCL